MAVKKFLSPKKIIFTHHWQVWQKVNSGHCLDNNHLTNTAPYISVA